MPEFPSFYPCGCPEQPVEDDVATAYRFVASYPPTENDFLPYCKEPQNRERVFRGVALCEACGTSLYGDPADALKAQAMFPSTLKGKRLVRGAITPAHGPWKRTPRNENSHMTWWIYIGGTPHLDQWV